MFYEHLLVLYGRCIYRNVLRISKSANLCTEPRADLENLCLLSPMASPTQTRKRHRADEEEFTDMASLSPTKVAKVHGYVQALSPMKQSSAGTSKYSNASNEHVTQACHGNFGPSKNTVLGPKNLVRADQYFQKKMVRL